MTINLTWQLFPVNGSYYDPMITSLILVCIAAIVVVVWGARSLAHDQVVDIRRGGRQLQSLVLEPASEAIRLEDKAHANNTNVSTSGSKISS
jgi:hypothetical protein